MPKKRFRKKQLQLRAELGAALYDQYSRRAQCRVSRLDVFQRAETVALYSPIRGEVATRWLFDLAVSAGKRVAYPRLDGGEMRFVQIDSLQELHLGTFGVLEPPPAPQVMLDELDLVVVPGVAFGRCGSRLGYGKGCYDQTFEQRPAGCVLVGLGFAFQLEDDLPKEEHDIGLDWIVTDRETLCFSGLPV